MNGIINCEPNGNTAQPEYQPASPQLPRGVYGSATLGKLFEALAKARAEFKEARLDSVNPHYKNKFSSLKAVDEATAIQLSKYGLAVTQQPYTDENGAPRLFTILGHTSGEWVGGDLKLILSKQDMQGLGASITYAKRYAKSAAIGVASEEDDDGNEASGIATGDQRQQVEREETKITATDQTGPCSEKQAKMIYAKAKAKNISDDKLKDLLIQVAGVRETSKVPWGVLDKVLNEIAAYKAH